MIRGCCRTSLDAFQECAWPESFVAVPRLGERVEGRYPDRESLKPRLKVFGATHCVGAKGDPYGSPPDYNAHSFTHILWWGR